MLQTAKDWSSSEQQGRPFLPRAFSHMQASEDQIQFLIDTVGPGTKRLAELSVGQSVKVLGPLGNGFTVKGQRQTVLVGGGIGVAPLLALQESLDAPSIALLGFRNAEYAQIADRFENATVATDDGSTGMHARIDTVLNQYLDTGVDSLQLYACGPPAMLEAVRQIALKNETPVELALEAPMGCGFGACFGCVVPTPDGGFMRLCIDGPVVTANQILTADTKE